MTSVPPSERVRVKRANMRGSYDKDVITSILDEGVFCHIGYVFDDYPVVTPTFYYRDGDYVYWHGSSAGRAIRYNSDTQVCFTVTHLDGLVLARSGFYHSANFRSVMIFGSPEVVDDADKIGRLQFLIDDLYGDRWEKLRPANAQELKGTRVLRMSIEEASAKIRTGPPGDDEADLDQPVWAGVIPVRTVYGQPEADPIAAAGGYEAPVLNSRLSKD